jgi:hypothetical protein
MAIGKVGRVAFAAFASALIRKVAQAGFRSLVGMGAVGGAVDYRSVVVDATVPGVGIDVSASTLAVMDEVPGVEGLVPIDLGGKLPHKGTYPLRDPAIITTHYWHHSATDTLASFEAISRAHIARGWPAIGYTGAIRKDGDIYRFYIFHPLDRVTNHTAKHNSKGVATVLVGSFDLYPVPDAMLPVIEQVRDYYRSKGINVEALHRDVKATACPGRFAVKTLRP